MSYTEASQLALVEKNLLISAGDARDTGLGLGAERAPGGGNGNPVQYSCLENPMDRGAWRRDTVPGAAKSQTWLSDWGQHIMHKYSHDKLIWCRSTFISLERNNFRGKPFKWLQYSKECLFSTHSYYCKHPNCTWKKWMPDTLPLYCNGSGCL